MPTLAWQRPSSQNRLTSLCMYPHDGCLGRGNLALGKVQAFPFRDQDPTEDGDE
jgi:hypothetical protein